MGEGIVARKNLLTGLLGDQLPAGNLPANSAIEDPLAIAVPNFGVMGTRGAIGAVSRSIEHLKAQSIVEIDPTLIEASFISDRLEGSLHDQSELVNSIREHGQQVPVLVRPHPEKDGRYQIAYGHRRLRAVAELGRKVRAVVKSLSDDQLVVAQGQENSARTDLSFIEKALFAAKLEERGFDRETIMAALSVDKTGVSRLISAAIKIPRDIIEAIGPAPKAGRDRWIELATRLDQVTASEIARALIGQPVFLDRNSDERFNKLFDEIAPKRNKSARPTIWKAEDGKRIARIKEDERNLTLVVDKKIASGFGSYLIEALPEIYAAYKRRGVV